MTNIRSKLSVWSEEIPQKISPSVINRHTHTETHTETHTDTHTHTHTHTHTGSSSGPGLLKQVLRTSLVGIFRAVGVEYISEIFLGQNQWNLCLITC